MNQTLTDSQKWLLAVSFSAFCWLIYLLTPILTPFVIALLLAYLGDPLVDKLEAKKIRRWLAVTMVFIFISIIILLILLLILPYINLQIHHLIDKLPDYIQWLRAAIMPWLEQVMGVDPSMIENTDIKSLIQNWDQSQTVFTWLLGSVSKSSLTVLGWIINIALIPILTFYLLRDWNELVSKIHNILPRRYEPTISLLAKQSDAVLSDWLRGQLTVMMVLATIYSLGLTFVGLEFALLIGTIAGLVSFVPYLGLILGLLIAGIASVLQVHNASLLPLVSLVFITGQVLEGTVLTPKLVGDKIGLHPVAVIFAIMAGGQLYGFFGVLLALPVSAVVMVLLRFLYQKYNNSALYQNS